MIRDDFTREATLLYWHDADTCRVLLSLGYYNYQKAWIRLLNYDAPELGKTGSDLAIARVNQLCPEGSQVMIQTIKPLAKSFDRWLGHVWQPTANLSVSDIMIAEHLTKADFL